MSPETPPASAVPSLGARFRLVAMAGLAGGALVALVAGSRPWWRASGSGVSVTFSGTDATAGLAQALALVALAGALLALVLRSRGRRVLGVLLVLAGAGALVVGLVRPRPSSATVQNRVLEVSLADQFALLPTAWPYVYGLGGLLVLGAAAVMTTTAGRWPVRVARFERPIAPATGPATTGGPEPTDAEPRDADPTDVDPTALWRLLDAGVDPTSTASGAVAGGDEAPGDAEHTVQPPGSPPRNSS